MHRHNTNFLGEKPIDSLQLMMDASNSNNGKITDEEIAANAFVFILAGYVPPIPYWGPQIVRICSLRTIVHFYLFGLKIFNYIIKIIVQL